MALRTASTAMARVERPEPREYSVSPTPTMQYLSRRWHMNSPSNDRSRHASAGRRRARGSLAAAARDRRRHAQSDVHAAGDPALAGQEARAAAQPAGGGAGAQRVGAVGDGAQQDEEQAEREDLRLRAAPREVDELRQEREEEQRRLGIQDIDDDAVDERAPQRSGPAAL